LRASWVASVHPLGDEPINSTTLTTDIISPRKTYD
jgi:hypothetical protein